MGDQHEMHVIPNTHWDREWLYDFQETRMQLVELFDGLLNILDERPEYNSFLLDSQAVPLEDYLQIRPENRARIEKHVSSGRLRVGPWYTCPEEFNVSGESLVRNLLFGHKVAGSFGRVMKIGYSPFSYGQNSQMAQIYGGFGIDTILFYHGVTLDEVPSEFILEGADGSRLLGTRMGSFARYNFFFDVYRPAVYGKTTLQRDYSWKEGGLPFHLCGPEDYLSHYFLLDPVKGVDEDKLKAGLEILKQKEIDACSTRVFAYMLGHDSYAADRKELEVVEAAKEIVQPDRIFMSSLEAYVERLRSEVKNLKVLKGERRTPRLIGRAAYLYHEVTSSRTRMKQKNARAENQLQRWAEPFSSMVHALGCGYPTTLLEEAWRHLLKCHPHDSIAGTGVDQLEKDMSYRLDQVVNISKGALRRAFQSIQTMVDNSDLPWEVVPVTVYNPSPYVRSEVVTAHVDLPLELGIEYFSIRDAETGEKMETQIFSRAESHPVLRQLNDATVEMPSERVGLHFLAKDVSGLGYRTFLITKEETPESPQRSMVTGPLSMESEELAVSIRPDGTLDIRHKGTGRTYSGLNLFVDDGESGMAWRHIPPAYDRAVTSAGARQEISVVESGPLISSFRVEVTMMIPLCLDEAGSDEVKRLDGNGDIAKRSTEEVELRISSLVTLRKGSPYVEITTRFDNRSRDHRLRVAFPSWLESETCRAEGAFDVVERTIERGPNSPWVGPWNVCSPQQRFVDVSDGDKGLAIINEGLREYEVSEDPSRTIFVTLMRAYEISLSTVAWRWERHPEMRLSQCPGEHEFRYAIMPHHGDCYEGKVQEGAESLNLPMIVAQVARHGGKMPKAWGLLHVSPTSIALSALKKAEADGDLVARVYNPTPDEIEAEVSVSLPVKSASLTDLEENAQQELEVKQDTVAVKLKPKKIATLKLQIGTT